MYTNYEEAKRYANAMATILKKLEVDISLDECQNALALGGEYRDWRDLQLSLASGSIISISQGFEHRVLMAVPRMALAPTARWIEAQIGRQCARQLGRAYAHHELSDRYILSYEYVRAIPLVHLSVTPELLPRSKPGVRLRQNILRDLSYVWNKVHFETDTMKLRYFGGLYYIFGQLIYNNRFQREFEALIDANVLEWREDIELLILQPPPLQLIRDRITLSRRWAADYYLAN